MNLDTRRLSSADLSIESEDQMGESTKVKWELSLG